MFSHGMVLMIPVLQTEFSTAQNSLLYEHSTIFLCRSLLHYVHPPLFKVRLHLSCVSVLNANKAATCTKKRSRALQPSFWDEKETMGFLDRMQEQLNFLLFYSSCRQKLIPLDRQNKDQGILTFPQAITARNFPQG